MPGRIFVVGHKNRDTDPIVSAIGCARLLELQGEENVIAARQGKVWPETRYVVERSGLPLPVLIDSVRPTARKHRAAA